MLHVLLPCLYVSVLTSLCRSPCSNISLARSLSLSLHLSTYLNLSLSLSLSLSINLSHWVYMSRFNSIFSLSLSGFLCLDLVVFFTVREYVIIVTRLCFVSFSSFSRRAFSSISSPDWTILFSNLPSMIEGVVSDVDR